MSFLPLRLFPQSLKQIPLDERIGAIASIHPTTPISLPRFPHPWGLGSLKQLMLVVLLAVMLTGCGGRLPDRSLVEKAIALQFSQTQIELARQLRVPAASQPSFSLDAIQIDSRQPLRINGLRGYRVDGTYTLKLSYPDRTVVQRRNPFEVYLQRQVEGKTWRLARPQPSSADGDEAWSTQLIQ